MLLLQLRSFDSFDMYSILNEKINSIWADLSKYSDWSNQPSLMVLVSASRILHFDMLKRTCFLFGDAN